MREWRNRSGGKHVQKKNGSERRSASTTIGTLIKSHRTIENLSSGAMSYSWLSGSATRLSASLSPFRSRTPI